MVDYAALYQQQLGRAPTAEALSYWQGRGTEGLSAFNAAAAQEVSARSTPTVSTPAASTAPTGFGSYQNLTNSQSDLNTFYKENFGRDIGEVGKSYWSGTDKTGAELASHIISGAQGSDKDYYYNKLRGEQPAAPKQSSGFGFGTSPRPASNVAQKIADVTAKDSPLMTQARTRGYQSANSRGLLNSSLAGQAAEQAVLDVAVPIGSQQDAQDFQANENYRSFGYNQALQEQENQQQLAVQSIQNTFDSSQNDKNITLSERSQLTTALNAADNAYQNAINNINANTNLTAETREQQLVAARDRFDTAYNLAEQIYNINLSW